MSSILIKHLFLQGSIIIDAALFIYPAPAMCYQSWPRPWPWPQSLINLLVFVMSNNYFYYVAALSPNTDYLMSSNSVVMKEP